MLEIEIVAVGKLSAGWMKEGCAEYTKRTRPYYNLGMTEIAEEKPRGEGEAENRRILQAEGERIIKALDKRRGAVIALCIEGDTISSQQLAQQLHNIQAETSLVRFVIGGSLGLSEPVKQRANQRISFGEITLPHQLARVVLLEQIYRAAAINNNIKYHK